MPKFLAVVASFALLISSTAVAYGAVSGQQTSITAGAYGGTTESSLGSSWNLGGFLAAGPNTGVQLRLGFALGHIGGETLAQAETLMLVNLQFGARIYLGAGVGMDWLLAHSGNETSLPIIALAGLETANSGPFSFFLEGAFLYDAIGSMGPAFRWGVGALYSF